MATRNCYKPTGEDRNSGFNGTIKYAPCPPSNNTSAFPQSMCCRIIGDDPDQCRDDGLCYNNGANLIFRESCTDPTWKGKGCVKLCVEESGGSDIIISVCEDGSFCCQRWEEGGRECCVQKRGVWLVDGEVVSSTSSTVSSASTAVLAPTKTPSADYRSRYHTSVIAAAVIGGVAAMLLIAGAICLALRNKVQQRKLELPGSSGEKSVSRHEVDGDRVVSEIGGGNRGAELEVRRDIVELD